MTCPLGISFEGGGTSGTGHLGVIKYMEKQGMLSKITHVSGSSAGCISAAIVALRMPYKVAKKFMMNLDYRVLGDGSWIMPKNVYRLITKFGWNPGNCILEIFGDILEQYIGSRSITLAEIRSHYGVTLVITGTDVGTREIIYFNPDDHPNESLLDLLRITMSLPLFYVPFVKNGHMYVDGGLLDNCPMRALYRYLPKERVISSVLVPYQQANRLPTSLYEFISILVKMLHTHAYDLVIDEDDRSRTIAIDIGSVNRVDFNVSPETKRWLIDQGSAAAENFFQDRF